MTTSTFAAAYSNTWIGTITGSVSKISVVPADLESTRQSNLCEDILLGMCDKRTGYMHAGFAPQHKYSLGNTAKYKTMYSPGPDRIIYRTKNMEFYGKSLSSYRRNNNEFNPSGSVFVGPCHYGMARHQVADGGPASDIEGSCENK